jgi:hypothetical protein
MAITTPVSNRSLLVRKESIYNHISDYPEIEVFSKEGKHL